METFVKTCFSSKHLFTNVSLYKVFHKMNKKPTVKTVANITINFSNVKQGDMQRVSNSIKVYHTVPGMLLNKTCS